VEREQEQEERAEAELHGARAREVAVGDDAVDEYGAAEKTERLNRVEARELRQIDRLRLKAEEHRRGPRRAAPGH
jgi:hypothetical protein